MISTHFRNKSRTKKISVHKNKIAPIHQVLQLIILKALAESYAYAGKRRPKGGAIKGCRAYTKQTTRKIIFPSIFTPPDNFLPAGDRFQF